MSGLEKFAANYREEAAERLVELEATLLELETHPEDADLTARAFRALHTIKGSGAMFGFDDIASFTHELESVFDLLRDGKLRLTRELVGLALEGKDLIRAMLDGTLQAGDAQRERLVAALRELQPRTDGETARVAAASVDPRPVVSTETTRTYRVRFKPHAEVFLDGTNPLGLLAELRSLGQCQVVARTSDIPCLEDISPERCYVAWEVILTTERGANAIRDVFIFVEDRCELRVEPIDDTRPVEAAAVEQKVVRAEREAPAEAASSIRVAAAKLDGLVDLVGELVIAQARLTRIASRRDDPELLAISEDIDRLSAALRDSTLDVRMVPIGTTFNRFKRLVRDLSAELGKEIDLVTEGAETELDKTVIERLGDPLVHLIRNSCDHGIESPAARRSVGKPGQGTVRLSAYHSGASVFIEIRDDGAGLDAAAIREKALERGLVEPDDERSEKELFGLVFQPGFSTAQQVSSVSGRGVGMDVVKRSIEALRGTVEIESTRGSGTTIRIKLPLTLAIIDGLLVAVGGESYVLPLSIVEECVELTRNDIVRAHGNRLATVRGELVPYLRLREHFGAEGERPPIEQIAIASVEGTRYGLVVDEVIGQHQTVIKSLGRMYRGVEGVSGATILGDGTVAMIVDVPSLVHGIAHPGPAGHAPKQEHSPQLEPCSQGER